MKVLEFSFKHVEKDNIKNFLSALIHHAYPKRHSLLFAYDYKYNRNSLLNYQFYSVTVSESHITAVLLRKKLIFLEESTTGRRNYKEQGARTGEYLLLMLIINYHPH